MIITTHLRAAARRRAAGARKKYAGSIGRTPKQDERHGRLRQSSLGARKGPPFRRTFAVIEWAGRDAWQHARHYCLIASNFRPFCRRAADLTAESLGRNF